MSTFHQPSALVFGAIAIALVGCADDPEAMSTPAPEPDLEQTMYVGSLHRSVEDGGGAVDPDTAVAVELWSVDDQGSMRVIAGADLSEDGTFVATTPAFPGDRAFTLVQAFDAAGDVVYANVVEETGRRAEDIRTVRLDPETTVETLVWRHRIGVERHALYGGYADIRTWIDGGLATEAYDQALDDEDGGQIVGALAESVEAAQAARLHTLNAWGWEGDEMDLYWARVTASQDLTQDGASLTAWERYLWTEDVALARQGAPAIGRSDAANSAALAFQLSILGRSELEPALQREALRSSMRNEAFATARILTDRAERTPIADDVSDATDRFWVEVYDAPNLQAGYDAFDALSISLENQLLVTAEIDSLIDPVLVDAWLDGRLDQLPPTGVDDDLSELLEGFQYGQRDGDANGVAVARFWNSLRTQIRSTLATSDLFADEDVALATELALHSVAHAH